MIPPSRTKGLECSVERPKFTGTEATWLKVLVSNCGIARLVTSAAGNSWRFVTFLALLLAYSANGQEGGTISGVVVSTWDGTPLQGVNITVRGTTLATQTDATGRYQLNNVPPGDQVLRFFKSGFAATVVTETRVIVGQTTTVNGNLRPEFYEMEETQVTAEEFTDQSTKIIFERQKASELKDMIGSDRISQTGARDVGEAIKNVTGVSVIGGKYAVVRGLSDRYTRTLLNGVEVPSADPYRMSPQLDLFPSAMVDRINVSKTFTPDQPGGTGGGTIDIVTKSFPEKPFVKASIGTSYNPNSNLRNDFLHDPNSSTAFLAAPKGPAPLKPELFGLDEDSLITPGDIGTASSQETRVRADRRAQQAATVQKLMQDLGIGNFAGERGDSPLNSAFSASTGDTVPLFKRNLGLFGAINYSRRFQLIEDAIVNRFNPGGSPDRLGFETRGNIYTDYGANANVGYDLSRDDQPKFAQLGFNFMFTHSSDDEARHTSSPFVEGREDDVASLEQWQMHYTERQILNYQLHGHHEVPVLADGKLDWVVSLSNTEQNEPDNRFMNYYLGIDGRPQFGDSSLPTPNQPARYYREIEEQSFNYKGDWTQPLPFMKEESKIKGGYYGSSTDRDFREQFFQYEGLDGFDPLNPNSYLNDPDYLQYVATKTAAQFGTNYFFPRYVVHTFAHPYTAALDVNAGYLMADLGVFPWLRLIGGARVERTLMTLDTETEHAKIDQSDLLPAASAIFYFTKKKDFDLRLSYGQTVARPSFREKAPIANYLPDLGVIAFGNLDLQMSAIKSYDARLEWYPTPGDLISVGVFYKEIQSAIELYSQTINDDTITWINRTNGAAKLMGAELEVRKSLDFLFPPIKGLSFGANFTVIKSETKLTFEELDAKDNTDPNPKTTRPLYDQSPYIINLDLSYQHPTSGTSVTIGSNNTGERIAIAKKQGPDIYEHPPTTLDAAISQKLWKHWTVRFGVRNILDSEYRYTYGKEFDGNIYQSYRRGRTYGLSLTAEF